LGRGGTRPRSSAARGVSVGIRACWRRRRRS
jgi:hypothetical protein